MTDEELFYHEDIMDEIEDEPTRPAIPSAMRPPPMPYNEPHVTYDLGSPETGMRNGVVLGLAVSGLFLLGMWVCS